MSVHLRDFEEDARGLIPKMIEDQLNIIEIPDSGGVVIIRAKVGETTTEEYDQRIGESDVTMLRLKIEMGGQNISGFLHLFSLNLRSRDCDTQ